MLIILWTTDICIWVYGVIHTTFPSFVVKITEFQGNIFDIRNNNMLPSAFAGKKKPPAKSWGV